jgi:Xaa-Pro aminopeptidase
MRLKLQNEKIGIDNLGVLTAQDYLVLKEKCPHIELVDITVEMAEIRGPKSKEEIELMEEAITLGAQLQKVFTDNLRPGMTEQTVVGKVMDIAKANGVESALWLTVSNEEMVYPYMAGEHIIRRELPVTFSTEFEIMGRYSCQIARMYSWEKPEGLYKDMLDVREELRHLILEELRPGKILADFAAKLEAMVDKAGFECDFIGHAIGLHFGEFPYISSSSQKGRFTEWRILADEVYVVNPQIRQKGAKGPMAFIGDMYFVGEERTRWMTQMFPGLPEIIRE